MATMCRNEAIAQLRQRFLAMTDDDHCMCAVAAERGVFCRGFDRYSDQELRERYWWIVRKRPTITREELESMANCWQLAQQEVQRLPTACDVQSKVTDTCRGWQDFTNAQLAEFYEEMVGKTVQVI